MLNEILPSATDIELQRVATSLHWICWVGIVVAAVIVVCAINVCVCLSCIADELREKNRRLFGGDTLPGDPWPGDRRI